MKNIINRINEKKRFIEWSILYIKQIINLIWLMNIFKLDYYELVNGLKINKIGINL